MLRRRGEKRMITPAGWIVRSQFFSFAFAPIGSLPLLPNTDGEGGQHSACWWSIASLSLRVFPPLVVSYDSHHRYPSPPISRFSEPLVIRPQTRIVSPQPHANSCKRPEPNRPFR